MCHAEDAFLYLVDAVSSDVDRHLHAIVSLRTKPVKNGMCHAEDAFLYLVDFWLTKHPLSR